MTWSPAARERVCSLWLSRTMPASQIASLVASEFGIAASKSSIIGIAYRAGLAEQGWKRPPGSSLSAEYRARKYERQNKERRDARAAARAALPPKPAPAPAAPKKKAPPRPAIEAAPDHGLPVSLRIPFVAIRDGMCRFIADDPARGPATCCGHPVAHGSPWCEAHRAICVTGMVAKPSAWIPYSRLRRAA